MHDSGEILESIRQFVLDEFPLARERNLADDESLIDSGVVDSLGILEIVSFLEGRFSIVLEDDDVVSEHFGSLAALAALVETKRAVHAAN